MNYSAQRLDPFALLSAAIALLVVLIVELNENVTFVEDCLLYLSVFLTLDKVMPWRQR